MDEAERDWIRRAQLGDGWAFEQLVSRYDRPILALARDMVGKVRISLKVTTCFGVMLPLDRSAATLVVEASESGKFGSS
jgi:hypothetical protein